MPEQNKIVGYKKIFGLVMPDWVDEGAIRNLISFMLVTIVMLGVLILVVNPNKGTLNGLKSLIKSSGERLDLLRESSSGLEQLGNEVTSTQQDAIFKAMPLEYSPDEAISSLRRTAFDSGVSIISYELPSGVLFQDDKKEFSGGSGGTSRNDAVSFDSFTLKVNLSGEVKSIMNFVRKVELSLPWGVVSDLGIQEVARLSSSKSQKRVELGLKVTYFKPILKSFDLTNLRRFTADDLSLIKELAQYPSGLGAANLYDLGAPVSSDSGTQASYSSSVDLFGGE